MKRSLGFGWLILALSTATAASGCGDSEPAGRDQAHPGGGSDSDVAGRAGASTLPSGGFAGRDNQGGSGGSGNAGSPGGGSSPGLPRVRLTASGVPVEGVAKSVTNPSAEEYEGMGHHSGESVVLGLRIKLTGIALSEKPPGQPGGQQGTIFDWSKAPKELAIERGFAGTVDDSAVLNLPDGSYNVMQVAYQSQYDLKAYAYLDSDGDDEVDTTVYTTTLGVKSVSGVAAPESLTDLDYKHYGFTYTHNADSVSTSTTTSFDITLLPTPIVIGGGAPEESAAGGAASDGGSGAGGDAAGAAPVHAEAGAGGANAQPSRDISVSLFIDAFRVVKAWDGVAPDSPADHVDVLFPQASNDLRSNQFGIDLVELYPLGQPTFGLQYLPTFAFANAAEYISETYLIAPAEPFLVANTQTVSVIFDGQGRPLIGRTGGNTDSASLQLGQAVRMFEPMGEDAGDVLYRYYVEYGIRDANNVDDGGMYYHDDKSMAGHSVEGFRRLAAVGDTAPLTIKDGPRCNAEYNRCLGDRAALMRRVR